MAIQIGSTNFGHIYVGSTEIAEAYFGSVKVFPDSTPVLPPNTIRCKFSGGYTPDMGDSQTLVDASENIWDIYKSHTNWVYLFNDNTQLVKVIAANTTGVWDMGWMFGGCINLTSVPLFDTSSVENMYNMFSKCTSLTSVPLFNTSSATEMSCMFLYCKNLVSVPLFNTSSALQMESMFNGCWSLTSVPLFDTSSVVNMSYMVADCLAVEGGALALYRQASTQSTPPTYHNATFQNCGRDTVTGAAELALIPTSWGGLGT